MSKEPMGREDVLARLALAEAEVRALGVRRLARFGSPARGEAGAGSDVGVLAGFAPAGKSYASFPDLCALLEWWLDRPVEVVTTGALSPYIGPHVLAEAADVLRAA